MRALAIAVACAVCAGCIETSVLRCERADEDGGDYICAPDRACGGKHGCVDPLQLELCANMPDLARCSIGYCDSGVCVFSQCGNGMIEVGEVCDDPFECASDCQSKLVCGNGAINVGEQCDDANLRSHDGCDSRCQLEELGWQPLLQVDHPERQLAAYCYDSARERLVTFGGLVLDDGDPPMPLRIGRLVEWDPAAHVWIERSSTLSPTARVGAAMACDERRRVAVMFGGQDESGYVADTWSWNGTVWEQLDVDGPSPRMLSAITYDSIRGRVVLFGGSRGSDQFYDDTWLWDGTTWTRAAVGVAPSPRDRAAFGFDPIRGVALLFGGGSPGNLRDTWLWDGTQWTRQVEARPISSSTSPTMTWDPEREQLVLVADTGTYGWDGRTWINLAPGIRTRQVAYFDRLRAAVTIQGGIVVVPDGNGGAVTEYRSDMQRLVGATWQMVAAEPAPATRYAPALAYDSARGVAVLYGGRDPATDNQFGDTWELGTSGWTLVDDRTTGSSPPALPRMAMTYDGKRQRTVLFGGGGSTVDVWEWDGATWTRIQPVGDAPSPRQATELAFDERSGRVAMFGGLSVEMTPRVLNDTWTWDGSKWHVYDPFPNTTTPPARFMHAMTYDRARGQIILHGGWDGRVPVGGTWRWTAESGWIEDQFPTQPPARYQQAFADDPLRRRQLLFGGTFGGVTSTAETWSLDADEGGSRRWTRIATEDPPPADRDMRIVHHAARQSLVMFGRHGTWELAWRSAAPDEACPTAVDRDGDGKAGCADPDCDAMCTPMCPPLTTCMTPPYCGDTVCDELETCRLCPVDCGSCALPACGDGSCDAVDCPADCP